MNEELIERYLLQELVAYGALVWERDDTYVFEGQHQDYVIEVRALPLGAKQVRLKETE